MYGLFVFSEINSTFPNAKAHFLNLIAIFFISCIAIFIGKNAKELLKKSFDQFYFHIIKY